MILPTTAIELDGFRRRHRHDTFWCGLLLGGCGSRLADKLYVTHRQCHFQHYPQAHNEDRSSCRRRGIGEKSADHLYVKRALETSLTAQERAARYSYPDPIGSLLDVDLDNGQRLRVHLDGQVRPSWQDGIPILGADVPLEPGTLSRCRYVYRVRLESEDDGSGRRVWIGTESLARPTQWTPLADCGWTTDSLFTPVAIQIQQSNLEAPPPYIPPLPESVTRLIRGLEAAQRSGTVEHVRRLCQNTNAFLKTLEPFARAEAEQALDEARTWLEGHAGYQADLFAQLQRAVKEKRAWDVRELYNQATALTRRGASDAEHAVLHQARSFLQEKNHRPALDAAAWRQRALGKLAPPRTRARPADRNRAISAERRERIQQQAAAQEVRGLLADLQHPRLAAGRRAKKLQQLGEAVNRAADALSPSQRRQVRALTKPTEERPLTPKRTGRATEADAPDRPRTAPRSPQALNDNAIAAAARAVRGALKRTARAQQTITWSQLQEQLGTALPRMSEADRERLIMRVDATSKRDEPLLSSVLAAGDPLLAEAYRLSVNRLGGQLPPDDRELLREVIEADTDEAHAYWRSK
ncbi:hypothetical protein [Streptomyces aureocirculatus]|uniref:hypothetical protein n=1 Tax=Streptomyces aureocirculatus TaxID=67275 RepID=UPI00068D9E97|nr:hypothetical protein [Streptomyces aureocirculatus]